MEQETKITDETKSFHIADVSSSGVIINDRYSHLKFKPVSSQAQLTVGMMIQIVESNHRPLSWEWAEITVEMLNKLLVMPKDKHKWIRIPSNCT